MVSQANEYLIDKLIEESGELIQALVKYRHDQSDNNALHVIEEMSHVQAYKLAIVNSGLLFFPEPPSTVLELLCQSQDLKRESIHQKVTLINEFGFHIAKQSKAWELASEAGKFSNVKSGD